MFNFLNLPKTPKVHYVFVGEIEFAGLHYDDCHLKVTEYTHTGDMAILLMQDDTELAEVSFDASNYDIQPTEDNFILPLDNLAWELESLGYITLTDRLYNADGVLYAEAQLNFEPVESMLESEFKKKLTGKSVSFG